MVAVAFAKVVAPDKPAPDQAYVTPDAGPPTNTVDVLEHVKVPFVELANGAVVF